MVYTGGPAKRVSGAFRGGYGVRFPELPRLGLLVPLLGSSQTAQRAELRAVCKALESAPGPLRVASDSSYVVRGIAEAAGMGASGPLSRGTWP